MIRRHGHYILQSRSKLDPNNSAYCLKCEEDFCTAQGPASTAWVFGDPCRGNWTNRLGDLERGMSKLAKEISMLRKWMAFDARLSRKARSKQGRSQEPTKRENAPKGKR